MRISEAIKLDHADIDWQRRCAARARVEVRQVALPARPRQHPGRARALRRTRATGSARTHVDQSFFVSLRRRRLDRLRRSGDVPTALRRDRRRRRCAVPAAAARPPPHDWPSARCSVGTATASTSTRALPALSTYLGHLNPAYTYYYLSAAPRAARARRRNARRRPGGPAMTLIAPTLQAFFTDRLTKQLHASPRTIASYRDTLRLLLCFANDRTGNRAVGAGLGRPRRAADHRVPRPPRDRPAQQRTNPQPAAHRDPRRCSATPRCATPNTPR